MPKRPDRSPRPTLRMPVAARARELVESPKSADGAKRMSNALYYGDNLAVLRDSVGDETVDLIYLDPPFNSNASYNILFKAPSGDSHRRRSKRSRIAGIGTKLPSAPLMRS